MARAEAAGHSWRTIRRASDEMEIEKTKDGFRGGWIWKLFGDTHDNLATFDKEEPQDPHNQKTSTKEVKHADPGHLRSDDNPSKAANGLSNGQLRKKPSGTRSFSDPIPEDGQDSDSQTDTSRSEVAGPDAERGPGRIVARVPTRMMDGDLS